MKRTIFNVHGLPYLKVDILPINQKEKTFFFGKIKARDFLRLFTVEPAEYDIEKQIGFAAEFSDDADYYNFLTTEDKNIIQKKDFQRTEDFGRVSKIKKFLKDEEYALFPNTLIVTCELINDNFDIPASTSIEDLSEELLTKNSNLSFLELKDERYFLNIPYHKSSLLIIDGQHRTRGIEEAHKELNNLFDDYDLLISFIIGYDKSTLAKLFYTINYNQKSVNKSLLYHLSGEFSRDLDNITFMHELVKILNEMERSPFHMKIKMLGSVPPYLPDAIKKNMTVSQAFLIDYLVPTISESATRSFYLPIFLYYFKKKDYQIEIVRFIIAYFNSIKAIFGEKDWNNPERSIVSKTISIGAFIKVMHLFFIKIFIDECTNDPLAIIKITEHTIVQKLSGIEKTDFSEESEFAKVASGGSLNKLKYKLLENITYFNFVDQKSFEDSFRLNYHKKFLAWLNKNC
jgi:DGQHR domain-containing protein